MEPEEAMRAALDTARQGHDRGEVPIGAVIVEEDRILAGAHNETIMARDPSAHAEIVAIRRAADVAGNHRLPGTTLYVTLEPCMMCFGAIIQARIDRLVFGARDPKGGGLDLYHQARERGILHGELEIIEGVMAEEAGALLTEFFQEKR
jgi:tRNA(adenine34) deaminase